MKNYSTKYISIINIMNKDFYAPFKDMIKKRQYF